jgi:succinoglycan biosynthesis protein ExoA
MNPSVTIILPTLNERGFIRDCLDSLLQQDYVDIIEVLVVDGGSSDGTRDIVERFPHPVKLLHNPRITAAAAMNTGIEASTGEVIVRADAHTLYEPDYVTRCVEVLDVSRAAVVGGTMRPVGTTSFGRAVAAVTSSQFGIGPGRFHYSESAGDVDTVYLGAWRRATLLSMNGYDDDSLQWGAEDQELNFRIRRSGGRIRLDPSIRSTYFPRATPRALWEQYWNYGLCKVSTLKKHGTLPYWRPLAPAGLVALTAGVLAFGATTRRPISLAVPGAYLAAASVVALRLGRDPGVAPHRAFAALAICHGAYGMGFWSGIARVLTGRPFDSRPTRHR